jgi:hypothetical protein
MINPESVLRAAGIAPDRATAQEYSLASRIFFGAWDRTQSVEAIRLLRDLWEAQEAVERCQRELSNLLAS